MEQSFYIPIEEAIRELEAIKQTASICGGLSQGIVPVRPEPVALAGTAIEGILIAPFESLAEVLALLDDDSSEIFGPSNTGSVSIFRH
ncbi:hypothetical protein ACWJKU_15305 [Methylocaldum sp. MU1018]